MKRISELIGARLSEIVCSLVTIPPVVEGNRLEIHRRLKLLQEREGVAWTPSTWVDGCRLVPTRRRKISRKIKG